MILVGCSLEHSCTPLGERKLVRAADAVIARVDMELEDVYDADCEDGGRRMMMLSSADDNEVSLDGLQDICALDDGWYRCRAEDVEFYVIPSDPTLPERAAAADVQLIGD